MGEKSLGIADLLEGICNYRAGYENLEQDPLVDVLLHPEDEERLRADWEAHREDSLLHDVTLRAYEEVPRGEVRYIHRDQREISFLLSHFRPFVSFMEDSPVQLNLEDLRRLYIQVSWMEFIQRQTQSRILASPSIQAMQVPPPSSRPRRS